VRSRYKYDTPLDLHTPLSAHELEVVKRVGELGMGPLEAGAKDRQPYDSLYVKLKRQQDYWRRS
jgi:hypothetical protein